jgi:hypothetical protein
MVTAHSAAIAPSVIASEDTVADGKVAQKVDYPATIFVRPIVSKDDIGER